MKVILTEFELLSEGKSAYLLCFCRRTGAKQIRSAEGADTARREEEAHCGGRTRGEERREQGRVREISGYGFLHTAYFLKTIYLPACGYRKKKSPNTRMVFQSTLVLTQPSVQAEGASRVPAKPRREPQGAPLFLMKHFNQR